MSSMGYSRKEMALTTLDQKIIARAGRLQLIVAALSKLAQTLDSQDADANLDAVFDELMGLAGDYGISWLDETADLLKNQYNRRSGP